MTLINAAGPTQLSPVCSFESTYDNDSWVIRLNGEFDLACAENFNREMQPLLQQRVPFVIDLQGLTFMDSTGLRTLVVLNAAASSDGFDLKVVCRDDGPVRRLLELTGIDSLLQVVNATAAPR